MNNYKKRLIQFLPIIAILAASLSPLMPTVNSSTPNLVPIVETSIGSPLADALLDVDAVGDPNQTTFFTDVMVGYFGKGDAYIGQSFAASGVIVEAVWDSGYGLFDAFTSVVDAGAKLAAGYTTLPITQQPARYGLLTSWEINSTNITNTCNYIFSTIGDYTEEVVIESASFSHYHGFPIFGGYSAHQGSSLTYGLIGNVPGFPNGCSVGYIGRLSLPSKILSVAANNEPTSSYHGYLAAAGVIYEGGIGGVDGLVILLDPQNQIVAEVLIGGQGDDYINSVEFLGNDLVIVGNTTSYNGDPRPFLAVMDTSLNILWQAVINRGTGSANDVAVDDLGRIFLTGYVTERGVQSNGPDALIAEFHTNGTPIFMATWGNTSTTIGNAIDVDNMYRKHVVGELIDDFPNQLATFTGSLNQLNLTTAATDVVIRQIKAYQIEISPEYYRIYSVRDHPEQLEGFQLVIEQQEQETTTTYTTITANISVTYPPCIDISTGTRFFMQADAPGTPEMPLNEPPDWGVVSPAGLTAYSIYPYASWYNGSDVGTQANWITAYADPESNYTLPRRAPAQQNYSWPDTTYAITFSVQVPSVIRMNYTADNAVAMYLDGNLVDTYSTQYTFMNTKQLSLYVLPGTHTIKARVYDYGLYTGLYVNGYVCPLEPLTTTVTRPTTTTTTETTTLTTTVTRPTTSTVTTTLTSISTLTATATLTSTATTTVTTTETSINTTTVTRPTTTTETSTVTVTTPTTITTTYCPCENLIPFGGALPVVIATVVVLQLAALALIIALMRK